MRCEEERREVKEKINLALGVFKDDMGSSMIIE